MSTERFVVLCFSWCPSCNSWSLLLPAEVVGSVPTAARWTVAVRVPTVQWPFCGGVTSPVFSRKAHLGLCTAQGLESHPSSPVQPLAHQASHLCPRGPPVLLTPWTHFSCV